MKEENNLQEQMGIENQEIHSPVRNADTDVEGVKLENTGIAMEQSSIANVSEERINQQASYENVTQVTQPQEIQRQASPMSPAFQVTTNGFNNQQYNFWQHQSAGVQPPMQQNVYYGNQPFMTPMPQKKKKENVWLKRIGKGIVVGIAAGIGFCVVMYGANRLGITGPILEGNKGTQTGSVAATVVNTENNITIPNNLTSVVDKCMPSIVSITSTVTSTYNSFFGSYDQDSTGSGSGIILKISEEEILIVTNNHVIDGAKKIAVGFYGADSEEDMVEAVVKGTDSGRDLAVVLVKVKDVPKDIMARIAAADIGSSDDARVGEMAIAIGNSLGYGQSLTVGYISAKDRKVEIDAGVNMQLLQTDAAINPGNSGGALLNADGQVIGINSAKYADTTVEGMGFAIPISDAISIINELMDREILTEEEKGYLGISGRNITEEEQQKYTNMPLGVYVVQVSEDGAAYASGIVVGDIIVGIDDLEILTIEELAERINSYRIGTKLTLKVMRYEKGTYVEKEIPVELKGKDTLNSIGGQTKEQERQQQNQNPSTQPEQEPQEDGFGNSPNGAQEYYDFFFGN